jgi:hypothetical protein
VDDTAARTGVAQARGFVEQTTPWGTVVTLDGHTTTQADGPVVPRFFLDLPAQAQQQPRGVLFTGGTVITRTLDAVIDQPVNEYAPATGEPAAPTGRIPALPVTRQPAHHRADGSATLALTLGQYDGATGVMHLFRTLEYDAYFSDADDTVGPTITAIAGYHDTATNAAHFKVEADDPSAVERVYITYTLHDGDWFGFDLGYDAAMHKWVGQPQRTIRGASYAVQAVDTAGNVTLAARKGGYFRLPAGTFAPTASPTPPVVYLPLVTAAPEGP